MASSNASSTKQTASHLPDLGISQSGANSGSLRKPHSTTATSKSSLDPVIPAIQSLSISSESSNTQPSTPTPKSNLSVDAKEFVPKKSQPPAPAPQQQQQQSVRVSAGGHHHQKSYNNGTNGTTRGGDNWISEASYPPSNDVDGDFDDYYALTFLTDFISQVSAMPHIYDEEIENLTEVLNSCIDEDEEIVLQCVVNNIVDQAIIDPNFRYSGVRLSEHLIRHLTLTNATKGTFKQELLSRCQREHSRRSDMVKSQSQDRSSYLRGFTLFVADLSTKLTNEAVLLNALPDLMETLLSVPSADNVKTVVLAMKLCGQTLESSRKEQFNKIISLLKEVANGAESSISNAVTQLMELIGRSWQAPPPPAGLNNPYASGIVEDPLPEEYERMIHDGMYGGPNGFNGFAYSGYSGIPTYDFGNGDEDNSEVVDAYEEFLRSSGQLN